MVQQIEPEKELTTMTRFGQIKLSYKCKEILKRFPSTISEQFNPHSKNDEFIIEILPNPKCKKSHYQLDLKRILPLLNKVRGKLRLVLPKDKPTEIRNSASFARDLQVSELVIEGKDLEFERYCICEADNLKKLTLSGVGYMAHCCCSKNRNLKELTIIPSDSKNVMVEGQLYKPADVIDLSKAESVDMEIPFLSESPFIYSSVFNCPDIKPQNRIWYSIDQYKIEKGALEVNTSANYKINTSAKFNIMIKDTDAYINEKEFNKILDKVTDSITDKTFAELLHLPKNKIVTVSMKDIYMALANRLLKEKQAACVEEIATATNLVKDQKQFDWKKQQAEQDKNIKTKLQK